MSKLILPGWAINSARAAIAHYYKLVLPGSRLAQPVCCRIGFRGQQHAAELRPLSGEDRKCKTCIRMMEVGK